MGLPWASLVFLAAQPAHTFRMTNYRAVTPTEGTRCFKPAFLHPSFSSHLSLPPPPSVICDRGSAVDAASALHCWENLLRQGLPRPLLNLLFFPSFRILTHFAVFLGLFSIYNLPTKCPNRKYTCGVNLVFVFTLTYSFWWSFMSSHIHSCWQKEMLPQPSHSDLHQFLGLNQRKQNITNLLIHLHFSPPFTHANPDLLRVSCFMFAFSYWNLLLSE